MFLGWLLTLSLNHSEGLAFILFFLALVKTAIFCKWTFSALFQKEIMQMQPKSFELN